MAPNDWARIRVTQKEKTTFDKLQLKGENQREKFEYLLSEYTRLKALEANGLPMNQSDGYEAKKQATVDTFLADIPDEILFKKDGEYKGKSLKGYPDIVKLRIQRLYGLLIEINAHLEPDERVEISKAKIRAMLNSNADSTKKAWRELGLQRTEDHRDKAHSLDELAALEKQIFPDSTYSVFEILREQRANN